MSQRPVGNNNVGSGIFSLFFREVGLFAEQAFKWGEEQAASLKAEGEKEREIRRMEAEKKLLEQAVLAKQAGIDPNTILDRSRKS